MCIFSENSRDKSNDVVSDVAALVFLSYFLFIAFFNVRQLQFHSILGSVSITGKLSFVSKAFSFKASNCSFISNYFLLRNGCKQLSRKQERWPFSQKEQFLTKDLIVITQNMTHVLNHNTPIGSSCSRYFNAVHTTTGN